MIAKQSVQRLQDNEACDCVLPQAGLDPLPQANNTTLGMT